MFYADEQRQDDHQSIGESHSGLQHPRHALLTGVQAVLPMAQQITGDHYGGYFEFRMPKERRCFFLYDSDSLTGGLALAECAWAPFGLNRDRHILSYRFLQFLPEIGDMLRPQP